MSTPVKKQPSAQSSQTSSPRDPDFSQKILEELYQYQEKNLIVVYVVWALTGLLGGHRFYLEKMGTGFVMLFTGGGGGIWWVVDAFLLPRLVDAYNQDQRQRRIQGLPPRALSFMPPKHKLSLPAKPEWADKRGGKGQLAAGAFVIFVSGCCLGAVTSMSGNVEVILAVVALMAITLLGARWEKMAEMPILNAFDRWNHRLKLYYFSTDPGNAYLLALRPLIGVFVAWRQRARAEVRLYLHLGAWFTILFTAMDLIEAYDGDSGINPGVLVGDMLTNLLMIYLFAAPIGAVLTTQQLLSRSDNVVWSLSGLGLAAVGIGGYFMF